MDMTHRERGAEAAPEDWSTAAFEPETEDNVPGEWDTLPYAVWTYDPRPSVKIAVRPKTQVSRWSIGASSYLVEVDAGLRHDIVRPQSTGRLPNIDLASDLMRGFGNDGVTATDLQIQLNIGDPAATNVSNRMKEWHDLEDLRRPNSGFEYIHGVGSATNERLERAVDGEFWERGPHDVVRNAEESDDEKMAVYVALPCLDGWRIRKEWRENHPKYGEYVGAWVMLPTEHPKGELYDDIDDATTSAERFAEERTGDFDDVEIIEPGDLDEPQAPVESEESEQAEIGWWSA